MSLVAMPAASLGCSLILDPEQVQCEGEGDLTCQEILGPDFLCGNESVCVEDPFAAPPYGDTEWGCLGKIPFPMAIPGKTHLYGQTYTDFQTQTLPPGIKVRLCSIGDLSCNLPVIDDVPIDEDGLVVVEVQSGFNGYFEVTSPDHLPHLNPLGGSITFDRGAPLRPVPMMSQNALSTIASGAGITYDIMSGVHLITARNCQMELAAGARFVHPSATADTTNIYFNGLIPNPGATWTDASGGAITWNIPVTGGSDSATPVAAQSWLADPTILAELGYESEQRIGEQVIPYRPGWVTVTPIVPSP